MDPDRTDLDPSAALEHIRSAAGELAEEVETGEISEEALRTLVGEVTALDEHLTTGGRGPEQWQRSHRIGRPRRTVDGPVLDGVVHGRRSYLQQGLSVPGVHRRQPRGRDPPPREDPHHKERLMDYDEIENRMGYHRATFPAGYDPANAESFLIDHLWEEDEDGQVATAPMHAALRQAYIALAQVMVDITPEGREQALAMTSLQESLMWANAAVAMRAPLIKEG